MTLRLVIVASVLAALGSLIAYAPASWIAARFAQLPKDAIVSGTLWRGQVSGLKGLAPVNFETSLSGALLGHSFFTISSIRPDFKIVGGVGFGRAENVVINAQVSALASSDKRLVNLAGQFDLTLDELRFGAACIAATGRVQSDVLQRNERLWRWRGPLLEGPIECVDGRLRVILFGEDATQSAQIVIEISGDGSYTQRAQVVTQNRVAQSLLGLYGFQQDQGAYKLLQVGRWQ